MATPRRGEGGVTNRAIGPRERAPTRPETVRANVARRVFRRNRARIVGRRRGLRGFGDGRGGRRRANHARERDGGYARGGGEDSRREFSSIPRGDGTPRHPRRGPSKDRRHDRQGHATRVWIRRVGGRSRWTTRHPRRLVRRRGAKATQRVRRRGTVLGGASENPPSRRFGSADQPRSRQSQTAKPPVFARRRIRRRIRRVGRRVGRRVRRRRARARGARRTRVRTRVRRSRLRLETSSPSPSSAASPPPRVARRVSAATRCFVGTRPVSTPLGWTRRFVDSSTSFANCRRPVASRVHPSRSGFVPWETAGAGFPRTTRWRVSGTDSDAWRRSRGRWTTIPRA